MQCIRWVGKHKIRTIVLGIIAGTWAYLGHYKRRTGLADEQGAATYASTFSNDAQVSAEQAMQLFVPLLKSRIRKLIPIPKMVSKLKAPNLDFEEKRQIWENLRTSTIESTLLHVYSLVFTSTMMCTASSVVAKYIFKAAEYRYYDARFQLAPPDDVSTTTTESSVDSMEYADHVNRLIHDRDADMRSFVNVEPDISRRVLVVTEHYLNIGMPALLANIIQTVCAEPTMPALDTKVSFEHITEVIFHLGLRINQKIFVSDELAPTQYPPFQEFLLPPEKLTGYESLPGELPCVLYDHIDEEGKFQLIMNEIRNIVDSKTFLRFFDGQLNTAFLTLLSELRSVLEKSHVGEVSVAKLIPALNNLFSQTSGDLGHKIAGELFKTPNAISFMHDTFHNNANICSHSPFCL